MKFKVGELVRVLPGAVAGFRGDDRHEGHDQYQDYTENLYGLLGIVTEINNDRDAGAHHNDIWVHLQNGLNNVFFYENELEKVAE